MHALARCCSKLEGRTPVCVCVCVAMLISTSHNCPSPPPIPYASANGYGHSFSYITVGSLFRNPPLAAGSEELTGSSGFHHQAAKRAPSPKILPTFIMCKCAFIYGRRCSLAPGRTGREGARGKASKQVCVCVEGWGGVGGRMEMKSNCLKSNSSLLLITPSP